MTTESKRTAAATAARMRKSENKWADHLRGRGYFVVHPDRADLLELVIAEYCRGRTSGISPAEVRAVLREGLEKLHADT